MLLISPLPIPVPHDEDVGVNRIINIIGDALLNKIWQTLRRSCLGPHHRSCHLMFIDGTCASSPSLRFALMSFTQACVDMMAESRRIHKN